MEMYQGVPTVSYSCPHTHGCPTYGRVFHTPDLPAFCKGAHRVIKSRNKAVLGDFKIFGLILFPIEKYRTYVVLYFYLAFLSTP